LRVEQKTVVTMYEIRRYLHQLSIEPSIYCSRKLRCYRYENNTVKLWKARSKSIRMWCLEPKQCAYWWTSDGRVKLNCNSSPRTCQKAI